MNCPNCGEFIACEDVDCYCNYCHYGWYNGDYYEPDLDNQGTDEDERKRARVNTEAQPK